MNDVRRGRRLKGLDEFEPPEFVGRMARVERRRKLTWYAMMAGGVAIGAGIGLASVTGAFSKLSPWLTVTRP